MKLSKLVFLVPQPIDRVGTQSVLKAEAGWELEATELGVMCRLAHPDGLIEWWAPLAAVRGGCPEAKAHWSAALTPADLERAVPAGPLVCVSCDFEAATAAALASHRRHKHPEAA